MTNQQMPKFKDIMAAAERISGVANKTPVITSKTLNAELGAQVFLSAKTSKE